jgi:xanthine dehydrogenase accessory factor
MKIDLIQRVRQLQETRRPYVTATVIRSEKPTSAKAGAKAIITGDGELTGWIGGSCTEPTIIREAQKALRDGQPRLVRLCPPEKMGSQPQEGVIEVLLACVSGGTLEIFIEPSMSQPDLIVIGHMATAEALARLAKNIDFHVTVVGLGASPDRFPEADRVIDQLDLSSLKIDINTCIVVTSHGNYDEDALVAALQTEAGYCALVASKTRAQTVMQYLRDSEVPEERINLLKYPAGIDIGAISPEEIALSILAEIIMLRRRGGWKMPENTTQVVTSKEPETAIDPVCGMTVEIATAHFTAKYEGQTYYFCSRGCQHSFENDPIPYLLKEAGNAA